ncbi:hypothetical protein [Actinocorallia sp. A-T 12471]|uniref:hypothetical protein n=1 Tax=Actinocorallia sp. A-T 12471 TaxID=3089813 RepID=UPI0029CE548B|nr:hypothetical protein [Actinocorallia sp. A-T 12471]MDX6742225.1 hypothetical protein [Actinocorallia sp. A-T 12471]
MSDVEYRAVLVVCAVALVGSGVLRPRPTRADARARLLRQHGSVRVAYALFLLLRAWLTAADLRPLLGFPCLVGGVGLALALLSR